MSDTGRLEAFSDGVIAIIITIMVLTINIPDKHDFSALYSLLPVFLSYVLSFTYVGIYWNNHHHMLRITERVSGGVLWTNLHLLFWLSLIPFATEWIAASNFASVPMAVYGFVLLMAAFAWWIMQKVLLSNHEQDSLLASAMEGAFKENISLVLYLAAIILSFVEVWISGILYVIVALIWLIPDRRVERTLAEKRHREENS